MINIIKSIPWWLAFIYFVSSVIFGLIAGVPIATKYYALNIPHEVNALFVLMAFGYSYILFPLCVVAAYGYNHLAFLNKRYNRIIYAIICSVLIPVVFYGVGINLYYN